MQVPVIKIAKEMGLFTVAADGNKDVPGAEIADLFFHIDLKDREKITSSVSRLAADGLIHGVMTAGTDFSALTAWAAEKSDLPGIPYESALNASDKGRMREVFKNAGVPSPSFIVITDESQITKVSHLDFPLVVKPVDNMGARGIRTAADADELASAVRGAFRYTGSGQVIIEEFISGPEFSVDALVYNSEVFICGLADRHIFFPPYFIEMGHTIPSAVSRETEQEILTVFKAGITALGITNGAAKGDIKLSKNGAVVGEIAARLSGGYMSGWTFPYSSGVEVTKGAVNIALGRHPGDLSHKYSAVSAERAFLSIPGTINQIFGLRDAGMIPGVKNVLPRVKEGDKVNFPENNVDKCGNIITSSDDRVNAISIAEEAVSLIHINLEPDDIKTEQFLFFDTHFPEAFPLDALQKEDLLKQAEDAFTVEMETVQNGASEKSFILKPFIPGEIPELKDWHYCSLRDILDETFSLPYFSRNEGTPLGSVFWKALLKGSRQGVEWLGAVLQQAGSMHKIGELLKRWK